MTMTLVKLSYNSKLVPDPGLVLQTPLWSGRALLYIQPTRPTDLTFFHDVFIMQELSFYLIL